MRASYTCNSLRLKHWFWAIGPIIARTATQRFIESLALFFNTSADRIFLFAAGRMALYIFLKSLRLGQDDEVIVLGYTCVVVPNAVKYLGIQLKYVDIDVNTLNLDTSKLWKEITPQTRVIIVSHNFGVTYQDIENIKLRHPKIIVIEDLAHSVGSLSPKKLLAGTFGDASFLSFEYSKPLTTGLGGALIVNNPIYLGGVQSEYLTVPHLPRLQTLRIFLTLFAHFVTSAGSGASFKEYVISFLRRCKLLALTGPTEIQGDMPATYPTRLPQCLAAFGFAQMVELHRSNEHKRKIAQLYHQYLGRIKGIADFYDPNSIFARYPILVSNSFGNEVVPNIRKEILKKTGIPVGEWFNDVVHPRGAYRYGYREGTCPIGESVAKRILNLPISIHFNPSTELVKEIAAIIEENLN